MGGIIQLLQPIGDLFHILFYEPVFNVLMLVYGLVHNFALAIVVLTILIRVALIPLTRAQLKSQQEMQRLQPELKRIQQQYRGDMVRIREEQQALYREHGVNPAKGCLPLVIQMPFLYALYYAFYTVLRIPSPLPKACQGIVGHAAIQACLINQDIYPFLPHFLASTVPQTWFIWTDLATPDTLHILPILAGVLTFLQLRMAMPVKKPRQAGAAPDPTTQATSTMQFIMPFITFFIGLNFPAGLALYWCFSTGFSAVQQYFINGRNFGSLFVGVPGMEHLVPPPKDLTTTTLAPPVPTRGGARAASAVIPSQPEAPPESGWRGLLQQLRESIAGGAPSATSAQTEAEQNGATNGSNGAIRELRPGKPASGSGGTPYPPNRRPRASRESAKLIRPASLPGSPADGGGETSPEDEINRAGKSRLNGKTLLPEQAIAQENTASAGPSGTNGANGNVAHLGGQNKTAGSPSNGQTRPSGSNYRKGAPGRRGGRPKGGR
ncbi:MAG TPA: membrane protein insertase YidC [Ktedonobacterales bacterium]